MISTNSKLKRMFAFCRGYARAKFASSVSRRDLEKLQKKKFEKLKHRVLSQSAFYKSYADKALHDFPIIDKAQYMKNFNAINTSELSVDKALAIAIKSEETRDFDPLYRGYSVGLSSGTSGSRGIFVLSASERAEWSGYIIAKMLPFTLRRRKVAFFLRANNKLYEESNGLLVNFTFFDLIEGLDIHIKALEALEPDILIAPASVLSRLAKLRPRISPKKIISVAEVLDQKDRLTISDFFPTQIDQVYQCTEGFLAATCDRGSIHLNEDINIIEKHWLNRESGRFSPIVTDLHRKIQPIVRYHLDDVLIEDKEECPCGSIMTRIKSIEGRKDDVLVLESKAGVAVDVYPDFIRNTIISACAEIEEYRVVQSGRRCLEVFLTPYDDTIKKDIAKGLDSLWARLDVDIPSYVFHEFHYQSATQKLRRVQGLTSV